MDAPIIAQGYGSAWAHETGKLSRSDGPHSGAALCAALVAGYGQNMASLALHAHASWWGALAAYAPCCGARGSEPVFQCSRALLAGNGYDLPAFADFATPASLIAALPFADAMRVLRMRSLVFRRHAVRRYIDRDSRARLSEWVGAMALEAVVSLGGSPQLGLQEKPGTPSLDEISSDMAAWEGWQLFERDGLWDRVNLFALVRMLFARDRAASPWIDTTRNNGVADISPDADGSRALLGLLPSLFPEWPWSFG